MGQSSQAKVSFLSNTRQSWGFMPHRIGREENGG